MKRLSATLPLLFMSFLAIAQEAGRPICGNDLLMEQWRSHYPEVAAAADKILEDARLAPAAPRGKRTIRVVVHVVWRDSAENLSDELIQKQMEVLNQDFNRLNPDTANLRSIFQERAGSADITFELEAVERVKTTKTFTVNLLGGTLLPEVKAAAQGGSNSWDPDKYLNIWICKIQPLTLGPIVLGQILGFAFPPADLAHWPAGSSAPAVGEDGVVIDFRVFGPDNPNPIEVPGSTTPLVVKGRTPTHEVGHYLGLRHIWGDGGTFGPNDCAQSDGVDDTPFANAQSEFDCDVTKNTCPGIDPFYGTDMPDLIENYMDYSSESCMNMLTKGQVGIIDFVLSGPRSGLVEESTDIRQVSTDDSGMELLPNLAVGQTTLFLREPALPGSQLTLLDLQGRPVWQSALHQGATQLTIPTEDLGPGIYTLTCQDAEGIRAERLVVIR